MTTIQVSSPTQIVVDGVEYLAGQYVSENPSAASAVFKAFLRWLEARDAERDQQHAESLGELQAKVTQLEADRQKSVEAYQKELGELQSSFVKLEEHAGKMQQVAMARLQAAAEQGQKLAAERDAIWNLCQVLMANGSTDAAKAAVQEIERLNVDGEIARLQAKRESLQASVSVV